MSQDSKDWLKVIMLMLASGCGVFVTSYTGGAKPLIAIVAALGAGATNVIAVFFMSAPGKVAVPREQTTFLPKPPENNGP